MIHLKEDKETEEQQCLESTNNKISDNVSYNENSQRKLCNYFSKYGYCKFGKSCMYIHVRKKDESKKKSVQLNKRQSKVPVEPVENKELHLNNSLMPIVLKESNQETTSRDICRYYKAGNCSKNKCYFLHTDNSNDEGVTCSSSSGNVSRKFYSASSRTSKKKYIPVCYYFKRGLCRKGDSCKFFHRNRSSDPKYESSTSSPLENHQDESANLKDDDSSNLLTENGDDISNYFPKVQDVLIDSTKVKTNVLNCLERSTVVSGLNSKEDKPTLRNIEINQMKKRFPNHETIIENQTFSFIFQPSDPDWPFDVRKLKIEVDFPESYPSEKCKLTIHQSNENIPELLIIHLNKAIFDWIENRCEVNKASSKLELMFRPFLRWFDKNLEELFITGLRKVKTDLKAKEDGIEFVPAENLFPSLRTNSPSESSNDSVNRDGFDDNHINQIQTLNPENPNILSDQSNKSSYYPSDQGTKLVFSNLELTEGAAALTCTKISLTLQCSRCKTSFSMKTVPKKNNSHVCSKCSKNLGFTFDPSTIHQFSSVLGNLHLVDCVAVDVNLVECHFLVDCLNCSKQVSAEGIHYGQKHKMWCIICHEKMLISIGSVKCQTFKLASVSATKYLPAKKIDKKVKDPVVKEGEPLPNFGACKHYKKSFRWLRFPCCGRLYPCDECHNEKETDHEMKYASRMICGFCAKEQPYSREKPCILCSQSLTKKSGSHWEGGKGCRNKMSMSRDDKQKYAGICKTVSKKAQSTKPKNKH